MGTTGNGAPPNGHGGTDEQDPEGAETEEPSLGDAPIALLELAESCRTFVLGALKVELDYEAETLPVLDEYLRGARAGIADRPETEPIVASTVAAYFGEVVRRKLDGFWRRTPDVPDEWQLCARRAYLSMSPLGMVYEALRQSDEHPGPSSELGLAPSDQEVAENRLAAFPEVAEADYYLLSTRLEVLEVIYEALRDRMKEEGRESIVFEPEDYDES